MPDFPLPLQEDVAAGEDVREWWMVTAHQDLEKTIPKAVDYGASDLTEIGRHMAGLTQMETPDGVDPTQFWQELGIHFYLVGKLARAGEAFREGRLPSADTLLDTTVYSMMQRRTRERGFWG